MVCGLNQQPIYSDKILAFVTIEPNNPPFKKNFCSYICSIYLPWYPREESFILGTYRTLIVPTSQYGLSMPLDEQAQREVMVLAGMIKICAVQFTAKVAIIN